MLAVQAEKQLGEFAVNVSFTSDTTATALFGPSGAGKTSVINMIAGLLKPERGRIVLGDDVLFDSATGINVPAWRRRIGYVFQEGRLFPHFSVKRNLDYGRWVSGHASDPRQLSSRACCCWTSPWLRSTRPASMTSSPTLSVCATRRACP